MPFPVNIVISDLAFQHVVAIFSTGMTVGAWLLRWRQERTRRVRLERKMVTTARVVASLAGRVAKLDGGRVTTRELPAYEEVKEDSEG